MRKLLLLYLVMIFTAAVPLLAQERTVTGKVTAADDGAALPGVNVVVKGSSTGTITTADGRYSIGVAEGATLVFSFVGLQTQEIAVGTRTTLDVRMSSDVQTLGEVVVTAVGITREKEEIGYAVTTVKGDELTKARDPNLLNSLAGKVAGVTITQQSGTVGGSSRIQIRGTNSLNASGNSGPLFIVDGIPISNSAYNGTRSDIINGGVDVANRASDLNPDDIASMTVLKGAAATALYGSRAINGAIIITTRRGNANKKASIEVNSSMRFDNVLKLPDFQNEYAQGNFGTYNVNNVNGWGPKISEVQDRRFIDFKGDSVTLRAHPDNVRDFFETGVTLINSVSLGNANENSDFRVGYTNLNQTGTIPNSELKRNSVSINLGTKFPNRFSVRASANYVRSNTVGNPAQGSNNPNILYVSGLPRTVDINDLRNNVVDEFGNAIALNGNRTQSNPFWITTYNNFTNDVERVFGNLTVGYDPFRWLNLTARAGTDFFTDTRRSVIKKGTINRLLGEFTTEEIFNRELNTDFIATVKHDFSDRFSFTGIVGMNVNQRDSRRLRNVSRELNVDQLYTAANAAQNQPTNFFSRRRLYGVYSDLGIGYGDFLFLNVTGRNDWSSTLPANNQSYFYPSVSASFVFTQLMDQMGINTNGIISHGKLRANYAQVGGDTDPYQLNFAYTPLTNTFGQYGLNLTYPFNGVQAYAATDIIPPADLRPERQNSYEVGLEIGFLNDRIGLDVSYYRNNTSDQIVGITVPQSTGFAQRLINAGEISNRGIEILLNATPVRLQNSFSWDVAVNFARNVQGLVSLAPGLKNYDLTSGFSGLIVRAEPGKPFGLYGGGWLRDTLSGEVIINPSSGLRQTTTNVRLGNIYPDWTMGINNTFSFKGITLSALVDIRKGGVIYSNTVQSLRSAGLAEETLIHRDAVFIDRGVIRDTDGTTRPNDVPVESMQQFWGTYSGAANSEGATFDASFVKLREVRLSYALPQGLLGKTPFGRVEIGVEGRNLWIINDNVPHIDPEANFFGPSLTGQGVEFQSVPTTRTFGGNLRFTF